MGNFVSQAPYQGSTAGPYWGTTNYRPQIPLRFAVPLSNCASTYGTMMMNAVVEVSDGVIAV